MLIIKGDEVFFYCVVLKYLSNTSMEMMHSRRGFLNLSTYSCAWLMMLCASSG